VKQAPDVPRAVPLRSHRHRGIQKLVVGQGAQESDSIKQVRFAHSVRAGNACKGPKVDIDIHQVLKSRHF